MKLDILEIHTHSEYVDKDRKELLEEKKKLKLQKQKLHDELVEADVMLCVSAVILLLCTVALFMVIRAI